MSPPSSGNRRLNRTPCKAKLWRSRNKGEATGTAAAAHSSGDGREAGDQSPLWGGSGSEDGRTSGCSGRALFGLSCSASSASLVQVQAMSVRIERTLRVGARSAICRHSTARCLHSTGVIIDTQPNAHKPSSPPYNNSAGFLTLAASAAELFQTLSRLPDKRTRSCRKFHNRRRRHDGCTLEGEEPAYL